MTKYEQAEAKAQAAYEKCIATADRCIEKTDGIIATVTSMREKLSNKWTKAATALVLGFSAGMAYILTLALADKYIWAHSSLVITIAVVYFLMVKVYSIGEK